MSNLIIPAAGAVIGGMIGGTTGAQIGWGIGSMIQSSREEIVQGTIGDLRVQTSSYGALIPYIIGKQRVAGNIIWASEKVPYEIRNKAGKGGPDVVTYGYRVNMLIGLCAGPILGVSRVWANGELLVDSRDEAKPLIGELYLGTMSQNADPTYQSAVGAANAPAYRGLAYMSLTNYDLGPSGVIPQFSFEVVRGATL